MNGALRLTALGLGLLAFQALLAELLPASLRPDAVLVFAAALGLRRAGGLQCLLLAFGIGFAVDVLSGSPPGLYALLRGTACAATRALSRAVYLHTPLSWALYCGAYALVDWVALGLLLRAIAPAAALPWQEFAPAALGSAALTVPVAGVLLGLFRRVAPDRGNAPDWLPAASAGRRVRL